MKTRILKVIYTILMLSFILSVPAAGKGNSQAGILRNINNNKQVIIVSADSDNNFKVKISAYENKKSIWVKVLDNVDGVIGKNGFTENKIEGDLKTPIGKFEFGTAFGKLDNPGTKMDYIKTTDKDYWVDDPKSLYYNTLQRSDNKRDWLSAEKLLLKSSLYDYAIDISYNVNPVVKGKGSAIFLHIWRSSDKYTAGCIATNRVTIIKLLKWLDPQKKPVIIEGTEYYLDKLYGSKRIK